MQLSNTDLIFMVSRLPKDVLEIMKEHKLFLGGGYIRATIAGEKPSDIDLFGASKDTLELAAKKLCEERKGFFHKTPNAITVLTGTRLPVQFISRWLYESATELIESFDFTIAKACVWYDQESKTWNSIISDSFYQDLAARRLVYTRPQRNEDAGGSILRVRKFLARGYNIQANSLASVIARLMQGVRDGCNMNDEVHLSNVLTGLLREVDPATIVDGVEIVDEHEGEKV